MRRCIISVYTEAIPILKYHSVYTEDSRGSWMPITILVKLTRIGNSLRLTVPKDVLRVLEWKEGDMLEVGTTDHVMTVKKTGASGH
jgi:hypothetical protein